MKRLVYLCSFACIFLSGCSWLFNKHENVETEEVYEENDMHEADETAK